LINLEIYRNGSPDVFSTFSALRSNTFSLAIGELLGASCFIISVVVGCMALVQPFQVPRWPFIRDVGFFTLSVLILVACLTDGKLTLIESGGLMLLYIIYVSLIVGGNWWMDRRGRQKLSLSDVDGRLGDQGRNGAGRLALPVQVENDGDSRWPTSIDALAPSASGSRRESASLLPNGEAPQARSMRSRSSSVSSKDSGRSEAPPTPSSYNATTSRNLNTAFKASPNLNSQDRPISDIPRPTFSLLGAIEFRDAINTLRKEGMASGRSDVDLLSGPPSGDLHHEADLSDYFGPITPYPSAHYHSHASHAHSRTTSPSQQRLGRRNKSVTGIPRSQLGEPESRNVDEALTGTSEVIPLLSTSAAPLSRGTRSKSISDIHAPPTLSIPDVPMKAQSNSSPLAREIKRAEDMANPAGTQSPSTLRKGYRPVPSINLIPADDSLESTLVEGASPHQPLLDDATETTQKPHRRRKRDRVRHAVHDTIHILFPALQGFEHKSLTGKILGVFASPAIFALTLTLPVVDDEAEGCSLNKGGIVLSDDLPSDLDLETARATSNIQNDDSKHFAAHAGAGLHHLILDAGMPSSASGVQHDYHHQTDYFDQGTYAPEDTQAPGTSPDSDGRSVESQQHSDNHALLFNKYLTAAQCVFGPLFCSSVFFCESNAGVRRRALQGCLYWRRLVDYDWATWAIAATTGGGCVLAIVVLLRAEDGQNQYWRLIRCFAGFLAAMTWIAAIADAVVDILRVSRPNQPLIL
jgi:sodium/potassium/calcium exchanger 6